MNDSTSRPTWARGLKHKLSALVYVIDESRPTWARGLKPLLQNRCEFIFGVAPHVGAWIETGTAANTDFLIKSRPTWARGLKRITWSAGAHHGQRRAPCGRVD